MSMDCKAAQEYVLEQFEGDAAALEHLQECAACAEFLAQQRRVDAQLAGALAPPRLSANFRANLRTQIRKEKETIWKERLPDVVHWISCIAATLVCLAFIPRHAAEILTIGAAATVATYLLQIMLRDVLENVSD